MATEDRPRIRSLQAVYGFLMVLTIFCLMTGYLLGPVWGRRTFDLDVHNKLLVFGFLLFALAFAVPFMIGTMPVSNLRPLAASPSAAKELAEQQFIDQILLGALLTMIASIYLAMLIWLSGQHWDMVWGALAAVLLVGRFPHAGSFDSWCRRNGITEAGPCSDPARRPA